jgi:hypothetical protein
LDAWALMKLSPKTAPISDAFNQALRRRKRHTSGASSAR